MFDRSEQQTSGFGIGSRAQVAQIAAHADGVVVGSALVNCVRDNLSDRRKIAPAIAAVGTVMLLPGLIFAGPIAVALAAAGTVGVAGGLLGALTNWGIPKSRVEEYEAHIREGGVLIGVKPRSEDDARYLRKEWIAAGGTSVHS